MWNPFKKKGLFNGMKQPLNIDELSDAAVAEYSALARELKENLLWKDAILALKYEYQKEIVNKVQTKKQLIIARSYLKVLDELELFVENAAKESRRRHEMKGRINNQYLPVKS